MEKTKSSCVKVSNHIPDDLTVSILSKLPLKSLVRFRCVRKSWSFLFQDSYFMNIYRIHFASNHNYTYADHSCISHELIQPYYELHNALFLYRGKSFENKVRLDWPPPIQQHDLGFQFMGSVLDGTLCFSQNWEIPNTVFWNINTNKFKTLPPSSLEFPPPFYHNAACAIHGFGYDHVTDDHKLIRHVAHCLHVTDDEDLIPPYQANWEVYSLRSNSWKKVDIDMSNGYFNTDLRVHVNGVCHWCDEPEDCLVSFDLTNDAFFRTPLPSRLDGNFGLLLVDKRFVALNGSVAFISTWETSCANKLTTFHISVLAELGRKESWTKLFIVGPLPCIYHPIGAGNKGDIFFLSKDRKLVQFDLITQRIEKLDISYRLGKKTLLYKEVFLPVGELRDV
ncbi:F-box only protein 8 [Lathyrus oleraceus]|uniref:F-box domain-containing protein n=1 Tax=Pisum sativum TaxID=3888 RepID=A0A9D5BBV8_PEA|nr:F-box only protein 8-like [Pisum sativum]KAI5441518.1 hypothetical protein KIW84_010844 [Pisum sativum]